MESRLTRTEMKILKSEAKGGKPTDLLMVIPTVIESGSSFELKLSLLDDGFPCFGIDAEFDIYRECTGEKIETIRIESDDFTIASLKIEASNTGFEKLYTMYDGKRYYSNPAKVKDYMNQLMLWGDPHIHTMVGDCHPEKGRSRNLAYTIGRHIYHMDWIAITDHISYGVRGTYGKWRDNVAMADLYNEPGLFTTLFAYEASLDGGKGGDNNVYFKEAPDMYIDPDPDDLSVKDYADKLRENPEAFFTVPHHTSRAGKHGEMSQEVYSDPVAMPVVEIHSKWGTSEYEGNTYQLKNPHEGPAYVRDFLDEGYQLGFVAGTDSHTTLTYNRKLEPNHLYAIPGLTCVVCSQNTREDIFDSIVSRSCYAVAGDRAYMDVRLNGSPMGSVYYAGIRDEKITLTVECASLTDINTVSVIKNGEVKKVLSPESWFTSFEWTDNEAQKGGKAYYYIRMASKNGSKCWSSPIWTE